MDFAEGKYDLVTRMKMFTLEEYTKIYDVIGDYVGSYNRLWELMRYDDMNIHKVFNILREWVEMHIASCINDSPNVTETVMVLKN